MKAAIFLLDFSERKAAKSITQICNGYVGDEINERRKGYGK